MGRLPDFLIIGAMKCGTSTLYEQLSRQAGVFLPTPKEPNFFSDDAQYAKGIRWYSQLFADAKDPDILGEASTHYTKLPTYPESADRMRRHLEDVRLIYLMRHPIERVVSHYIHAWTENEVSVGLDEAVTDCPKLIHYSCYAKQLLPYLKIYGSSSVLPVFLESMMIRPQQELERVCEFIGLNARPMWHFDLPRNNVSSERIRKFPFYDYLIESSLASKIRRRCVPKFIRERIRQALTMRTRPTMSPDVRTTLEATFDRDLAVLGEWMGVTLRCDTFERTVAADFMNWKSGTLDCG